VAGAAAWSQQFAQLQRGSSAASLPALRTMSLPFGALSASGSSFPLLHRSVSMPGNGLGLGGLAPSSFAASLSGVAGAALGASPAPFGPPESLLAAAAGGLNRPRPVGTVLAPLEEALEHTAPPVDDEFDDTAVSSLSASIDDDGGAGDVIADDDDFNDDNDADGPNEDECDVQSWLADVSSVF